MKPTQQIADGPAIGTCRRGTGMWLLSLLLGCLVCTSAAGQNRIQIDKNTPSDFSISDRFSQRDLVANGYTGFTTKNYVGITNSIGGGFGMDVKFSTSRLLPGTEYFLFSVGKYQVYFMPTPNGIDSFEAFYPAVTVSVKNGQLVLKRALNPDLSLNKVNPNFAISSWSLNMFAYGKPLVDLQFKVSNNAIKFYFSNPDDANSRTCELLFYGMDQTYAKTLLTKRIPSVLYQEYLTAVVLPQKESYFTNATMLRAENVAVSPPTASPIAGRGMVPDGCDCKGSLTPAQGGTNNTPLDLSSILPMRSSYQVVGNSQARLAAAGLEAAPTLTVYPNPAHRTLNLALTVPAATPATATLLDALGRTVFSRTLALQAGPNRPALALEALPAGIYQLVLKLASGSTPRLRQKVVLE